MSLPTRLVPLSHDLGAGTAGQTGQIRDKARDSSGTADLKALARKVLERDKARDSGGTENAIFVPAPDLAWDKNCPAETPGLRRVDGAPADWIDGVTHLRGHEIAGFSAARSTQLAEDGERFLASWAARAAALGWSTLELFGVHPSAPASRVDSMGLVVLLHGRHVVAMTDDAASIRARSGAALVYRRRVGDAEAVPIWSLCDA